MKETLKQRQHKLIQLGGLIRISGLEGIEIPILLGVLLEANRSYESLPEGAKKALFKKGFDVLTKRKETKKPYTKKQKTSNKFYERDKLESWNIL